MVNDQLIEAGDYTVELVSNTILRIRDRYGRPVAAISTNTATMNRIPKKTVLEFNRYKEDYFLSKVFWAGFSGGREVYHSRRDLLLASKPAPRATISLVKK